VPVLSEIATMTEVAQGRSLARLGHGELLIMAGKDAEHQKYDRRLEDALWEIWRDWIPSGCLVAMPPFDPLGWDGFLKKYGTMIRKNQNTWYGSSFVSRHDWVPWTREYRALMQKFLGGPVPLVVSPQGCPSMKLGDHIVCASENAYDDIEELEYTLINQTPRLAILSCGPTATVLADRLARKGIWAVDLGNFWKFL